MDRPDEEATVDDIDRRILCQVQADARISNADLARRVGIPESTAHDRLRRLEARGLIRGYQAVLDHQALGLEVTAFTIVQLKDYANYEAVQTRLKAVPEVLEVHFVAGDGDFLIKLRTSDPGALHALLREAIQPIPGVMSLETRVVLHTSKESLAIPEDGLSTRDRR